jgi:hypothetical protein
MILFSTAPPKAGMSEHERKSGKVLIHEASQDRGGEAWLDAP